MPDMSFYLVAHLMNIFTLVKFWTWNFIRVPPLPTSYVPCSKGIIFTLFLIKGSHHMWTNEFNYKYHHHHHHIYIHKIIDKIKYMLVYMNLFLHSIRKNINRRRGYKCFLFLSISKPNASHQKRRKKLGNREMWHLA